MILTDEMSAVTYVQSGWMGQDQMPGAGTPRGPELFNEVCGAPQGSDEAQSQAATNDFAEWTPTDLWFGGYTSMLQGEQPSQVQDARASRQSESQSSQASAAEGQHRCSVQDTDGADRCVLESAVGTTVFVIIPWATCIDVPYMFPQV